MSKRMIIFENCEDCPNSCLAFLKPELVCLKVFEKDGERFCPKEGTPDWCPLPNLPKRKENVGAIMYEVGEQITEELADRIENFGFNICLDTILRGGE